MTAKVQVELSVKDAESVRAWQRAKQGADEYEQELKKVQTQSRAVSQATKQTGADTSQAFTQGAASIRDFIGAFAGITGVMSAASSIISLVRAEYDSLLQRNKTAGDRQVDLAAAQRQAVFNLGDDKLSPEEFIAGIDKIAAETGVTKLVATRAASDAASARGDKSGTQALAATKAALRLAPDQPENAPMLAGSALDIGKATGMGPEAALGLLLSTGTAARVTQLKGLSENITPGMLGVMQSGDSVKQAGALVATISQGLVDPTGAQSKTTSIALSEQLKERLPELSSTEERIRAVQADPKLYKKFFEGGMFHGKDYAPAAFERAASPNVRALLSNTPTPLSNSYNSALNTVADPQQALKLYNDRLAKVDALGLSPTAKLGRLGEGGGDRIDTGNVLGGITGKAREALVTALEKTGTPVLERTGAVAGFDTLTGKGHDPVAVAAGYLERRANIMSTPREGSWRQDAYIPTPQLLRDAEILREMVVELKAVKAEIERQNNKPAAPVKVEIKSDKPVRATTPPAPRPAEARASTAPAGRR